MGSPNGGIIGVINPSSFGKDTQTVTTTSGNLTTQPGTQLVDVLLLAVVEVEVIIKVAVVEVGVLKYFNQYQ
jgi:hypothetical protein